MSSVRKNNIKNASHVWMMCIKNANLGIINFYFLSQMTGTVKFFNDSKGFGFITNDDTGQDIFVHVSNLNGLALNEGDNVSYVEEEGRKGMVAAQVQIIE